MFSKLGRFEIKDVLGRGAMGEVYLGVDPVLGREVAIKTILSSALPDDHARQRFDREAKAAAVLNSPNIVTIHELGEDQGVLFIAMERLKGQDLEQILLQRSLTLVESLEVLAQVCDGLDAAHRNHIIHRDVKPSNIMVMREGRKLLVKLMDFGVARLKDSAMTMIGTVVGTVNYIAPEYIRSGEPDARSDLFAVGVMLYECIAGRKPFEGGSASTVLFKIVNDPPDPLDLAMLQGLNPALRNMTEKALAKDPDDRFQSAEEFALALRAAKDPAWNGKVAESTVRMKIWPLEPPPAIEPLADQTMITTIPVTLRSTESSPKAITEEVAVPPTLLATSPAAKTDVPVPTVPESAKDSTQVVAIAPSLEPMGGSPAFKTAEFMLPLASEWVPPTMHSTPVPASAEAMTGTQAVVVIPGSIPARKFQAAKTEALDLTNIPFVLKPPEAPKGENVAPQPSKTAQAADENSAAQALAVADDSTRTSSQLAPGSSKGMIVAVLGLLALALLGGMGYIFFKSRTVPTPSLVPISPTPSTAPAPPPPVSIPVPQTQAPAPEAPQPIPPANPPAARIKPTKPTKVPVKAPTPAAKTPMPVPVPAVVASPLPPQAAVPPPPPPLDAKAIRKPVVEDATRKRMEHEDRSRK